MAITVAASDELSRVSFSRHMSSRMGVPKTIQTAMAARGPQERGAVHAEVGDRCDVGGSSAPPPRHHSSPMRTERRAVQTQCGLLPTRGHSPAASAVIDETGHARAFITDIVPPRNPWHHPASHSGGSETRGHRCRRSPAARAAVRHNGDTVPGRLPQPSHRTAPPGARQRHPRRRWQFHGARPQAARRLVAVRRAPRLRRPS